MKVTDEQRGKFRDLELENLELFNVFEPVQREQIGAGAVMFKDLWVETNDESRFGLSRPAVMWR